MVVASPTLVLHRKYFVFFQIFYLGQGRTNTQDYVTSNLGANDLGFCRLSRRASKVFITVAVNSLSSLEG